MAAEIETENCRNCRNGEPPGKIKTKSILCDEDNDNNPATFSITADRENLRIKLRKTGIQINKKNGFLFIMLKFYMARKFIWPEEQWIEGQSVGLL